MSNYLLLNHKARMVLGELDSNVNKGYPIEVLDILINQGIVSWFQEFMEGVEATQTIHDKLSSLVVRTPMTVITSAPGFQTPLSPASSEIDSYEFRFKDLDYPYYRFMGAYAMIQKGNCEPVRGKVRLEQHDDLETVLIDEHRKPSWRYREVVGVLHRDSKIYTDADLNTVGRAITLYTDNFNVNTLHLTYLKEPNVVSFGGYIGLDGNVTVRTECDIPPIYYDKIAEHIAKVASQSYGFTNNNK